MAPIFSELITQLAEELETSLQVDSKGGCSLLFDDKIRVQLEMDKYEQHLMVIAFATKIPPGKFREKVLFEALKINNDYPRFAVLGYYDQTAELILHHLAPLENLTGKTLLPLLQEIVDLAILWNKAIENNLAVPTELLQEPLQKKASLFDRK